MSNLLFICSKNQWRSPTAELLFRAHPTHAARSAGTSNKARVKISQKIIDWSDVIFAMESKHRDMIMQRFYLADQTIIVLDITDNYQFGDAELIEILRLSLTDFLKK